MKIPLSAGRVLGTVLAVAALLNAAEHKGQVKFGGLPLPGATIIATQGDKTLRAVADGDGNFAFADLPDGTWNFQVEMQGFSPIKQDVTIAGNADIPEFDLKMLSFDEIKATAAPPAPPPAPRISVTQNQEPEPAAPGNAPAGNGAAAPATAANGKPAKGKKGAVAAAAAPANGQTGFQRAAVNANANGGQSGGEAPPSEPAASGPFGGQSGADLAQRASDGLLINGTTNNGASSPFAQNASFGNNRRGPGSLYNGNLALIEDNSALDAKTYSFTGQNTPKPYYDHIRAEANFGGPLRIPHLLTNGPQFFVNYAMIRNHTAQTQSYLVPTADQRAGDLAGYPTAFDPTNGAPFAGNVIPSSRISQQALGLLNFYPAPNFHGSSQYNYQIPIVGETHQDQLRAQLNKNIGNRNNIFGFYAFQRQAMDNPNEFGFLDKTSTLGMNTQVNWQHRMGQRMFVHFQVSFSRFSSTMRPWFENRTNVSGQDGITGNNQEPINWGPPSLNFGSGIASLSDGIPNVIHNQTTGYTYDTTWSRGRHNISWGGDFNHVEFNAIGQQNPRGAFTFNGAYTATPGAPVGNDFADFLLGVPDTASVGFGNADKYFRQNLYDAFVNDDWRVGPSLTIKPGVRWEYQAPITELYGRLANLDVAPGFTSVQPVTAVNPTGSLTGLHYGDSLVHPDRHAFQPRVAVAWRPIPASSLIVRLGYGVYYNTSVYQTIAQQLATQAPFATSLSVQNTPQNQLSMARGFVAPPNYVTNTFGIDPNFRVGYAQNYQASIQRDLPGSLVMTVTYLGIKGTRGMQEFLPNTYPTGAANPCPLCPTGFIYMVSNGNSTRQSGSFQLRRRLHNGFLASATYTFAKAIDDSALGGRNQGAQVVAQNWLNLAAERSLSNFDQRHNVAFQAQYTSGQGIGGGTLLNGWRGALLKEWTIGTTINAGTGLPLTPYDLLATQGTGVTAQLRPDYTGEPLTGAPGFAVNPAAFVVPPNGQWGNAGRNSITGPVQFTLNGSLGRTFRLKDRYSLDLRFDATNALNHVTFTSYNTQFPSPQFGLPNPLTVNGMRDIITNIRLRF